MYYLTESKNIELTVVEDKFHISSYTARVNRKVFDYIIKNKRRFTVLKNKANEHKVRLQPNPAIEKDQIYLPKTDMEKLEVKEGDDVILKAEAGIERVLAD